MVDIHSHLLHGVDDGSPNLETSVRMAEVASQDGITRIVCTPHASQAYQYSPSRIATHLSELRNALAVASIPVELGLGSDFHITFENIVKALAEPRHYTINETEYLLIELPDWGIPPNLENTLYSLRLKKITPILTHPERNPTLQRQPTKLIPWLQGGLLMQLTANSLTGDMGRRAQEMSQLFLRNNWVHVVATDSHNLNTRPPLLSKARNHIANICGQEYADLLCKINPGAIFDGIPFPDQHDMKFPDSHAHGKSVSWWTRIANKSFRRR